MSTIEQIRQTAERLRAELASPDAPPPTLEEARALAEAAIVLVEENARLTAVAESARSLIAAADACDREAERHPSSRSSAPVVRSINAMARLRQALGGTAPTAERKPVAGWQLLQDEDDIHWIQPHPLLRIVAYDVEASNERSFVFVVQHRVARLEPGSAARKFDVLAKFAVLFAAEDALFGIADAINALRETP